MRSNNQFNHICEIARKDVDLGICYVPSSLRRLAPRVAAAVPSSSSLSLSSSSSSSSSSSQRALLPINSSSTLSDTNKKTRSSCAISQRLQHSASDNSAPARHRSRPSSSFSSSSYVQPPSLSSIHRSRPSSSSHRTHHQHPVVGGLDPSKSHAQKHPLHTRSSQSSHEDPFVSDRWIRCFVEAFRSHPQPFVTPPVSTCLSSSRSSLALSSSSSSSSFSCSSSSASTPAFSGSCFFSSASSSSSTSTSNVPSLSSPFFLSPSTESCAPVSISQPSLLPESASLFSYSSFVSSSSSSSCIAFSSSTYSGACVSSLSNSSSSSSFSLSICCSSSSAPASTPAPVVVISAPCSSSESTTPFSESTPSPQQQCQTLSALLCNEGSRSSICTSSSIPLPSHATTCSVPFCSPLLPTTTTTTTTSLPYACAASLAPSADLMMTMMQSKPSESASPCLSISNSPAFLMLPSAPDQVEEYRQQFDRHVHQQQTFLVPGISTDSWIVLQNIADVFLDELLDSMASELTAVYEGFTNHLIQKELAPP